MLGILLRIMMSKEFDDPQFKDCVPEETGRVEVNGKRKLWTSLIKKCIS